MNYLHSFSRCLTLTLVVFSMTALAQETKADADSRASLWRTERMKLADSPEYYSAFVQALNHRSDEEISQAGVISQEEIAKFTDDTLQVLLSELSDKHGVHVETVFATLGALIGFSSQMALREYYIPQGHIPEKDAFLSIQGKDGKTYYYGDSTNGILLGSEGMTPWLLLSDTAQKMGAKNLPEIGSINKHVVSTIGSDAFGVPQLPPVHMPHEMPYALLNKYWNPVRLSMADKAPHRWPGMLSLVAIRLMEKAKDVLPPDTALQILMESAIPMAYINPADVHNAYLLAPQPSPKADPSSSNTGTNER